MTYRLVLFTVALLVNAAATASAQVVGTFRWQTQPYCNVITLTVVRQGGQFLLNGRDDLCGAGVAPITGTAIATGANVAMGMTAALPGGAGVHLTAMVALATVSGSWQDADGRTGTFQFLAGPGTGGSPRPAPASAATIFSTQLSPTIFAGTGSAQTIAHSDHTHDARYAPRSVTMQISGLGLTFLGSTTLGTANGCATSINTAGTGYLTLDVPFGATVTSLVARVWDGNLATYQLRLRLDAVVPTGLTSTEVASASGGGLTFATVAHTLTPASPLTIAPGHSMSLSFETGGSFANGLCSVELNYTLPPAA